MLKTTTSKLQQLNALFVEKQEVLEEQLENRKMNNVGF